MPEKKQSAWRFLWRSEDIRRKLLITLGILMLFRIAANIPAPGVDRDALAAFFQAQGGSGGFLGFLNLLSGGTIANFSLLSMGVYPYITAQIILQLLVPIIPALQRRMQEDQREGRRWMEKVDLLSGCPYGRAFGSGPDQYIQFPGRAAGHCLWFH
jgi:preprotein translocase subunit SecY